MATTLLVVNGADYTKAAVQKAVWLAKQTGGLVEILYVNPSCVQLHEDNPGYCFWLLEQEYQTQVKQLMDRILNQDVIPLLQTSQIDNKLLITNNEQDKEIKQLCQNNNYDKIFITGRSKYCTLKNGQPFKAPIKTRDIINKTVCFI